MEFNRLVSEVSGVYERLEAELPKDLCSACGKCCHFQDAGHILFVTTVERLYFDAKHGKHPRNDEPAAVCPFLDGSTCTARDGRPLACRTHFCSEERTVREARYEKYLVELKEIGRRHGVPYDYSPFFMKPAYQITSVHDCPPLKR